MAARLKLSDDESLLLVQLSGLKGADFQEALGRVKAIPGRRFNGTTKDWELPAEPDTALRVMAALSPNADARVQAMVRAGQEEAATQLVTNVGEDADLVVPYADKLFPYQRAGVDALVRMRHGLLCDEMGLGKTVEAISTVNEARLRDAELDTGNQVATATVHDPILVIAPRAVRGTWASEFEVGPVTKDGKPIIPDWVGVEARPIDGRTPKKREKQLAEDAGAYVLNWEAFWRDPVLPLLAERNWGAIFADEAHRGKNRKSKQSMGLRGKLKPSIPALQAPIQLALTGTPVMNSPDELWALLAWLFPKEYTSYWAFRNMYVDEYIAGHNQRVIVGVKNADKLRFELSSRLVRRRKTDVLDDLPEKMEPKIIEVELTPAQRKLYDEVDKALILDVAAHIEREVDARLEEENDPLTETEREYERQRMIADRAEELASLPLHKLVGLVENAGARIAKLRQITASAKAAVADELIREEPDTPVVAFTWHVDAARQLADALSKGRPRLRVGTIAGNDDPDPVKVAFQEGELDHVVCTIAKGGTGLTLTRSSNPLMVEEDWVPSINDQAIDRTHRLGQTEPVTPRILRCPNTVDTGKVAPKIKFKQSVMAQVGFG